jgi:hypothetical protein
VGVDTAVKEVLNDSVAMRNSVNMMERKVFDSNMKTPQCRVYPTRLRPRPNRWSD